MKFIRMNLLIAITLFVLIGCAAFQLKDDSETMTRLEQKFYQAKACTGLRIGDFRDLEIILMPPRFSCPYYFFGCRGEFNSPNTIKVGTIGIMKHETVHYLLYRNTGNADGEHRSPLFERCG